MAWKGASATLVAEICCRPEKHSTRASPPCRPDSCGARLSPCLKVFEPVEYLVVEFPAALFEWLDPSSRLPVHASRNEGKGLMPLLGGRQGPPCLASVLM